MDQNEMVLPRLGFWGRLLGVYFSPTETFGEMGATLGGGVARITGILLPLMALIMLTAAATIVAMNRLPTEKLMTEQVDRMVEEGKLTPEQAETQREQMAKFAPYTKIIAPIAAVFTVLLMSLIFAGVAKLISMMMGIENQFLPLWAVTTVGARAPITVSATAAFLARLSTRGAVAGLGCRLAVWAGAHALGRCQISPGTVAFGQASLIGPG